MKGDFSRFTFNSKNRYSRVLMQQGRVQLDADWNEQLDISAYRTETEITDFIGQSGAPENNAGFAISVGQGGNLAIGQGRFYIEGMLFENHLDNATFTNQPDFPNVKIEDFLAKGADGKYLDGQYLVYLDVWQRHITALEDPSIREVALGGADTATRVKNVWQVKLKRLDDIAKWKTEPSLKSLGKEKRLSTRWEPTWENALSEGGLKASVSQQQSGTVLGNQLYRVEIHTPGNAGTATFKWSRDNGAIAFQIESANDNKIQIKQSGGRDLSTTFTRQLIEYTDETIVLSGSPGYLAKVTKIQGNTLFVEWLDEKFKPSSPLNPSPIVRLWDSEAGDSQKDALLVKTGKIQLEGGIEVEFEENKHYKTGDYWLIPSRYLKGDIEWNGNDEFQPPQKDTLHRYCALANVKREGGQFTTVTDYRFIFKPITSGLVSKAGDRMTGSLTIDKNLYVNGKAAIGYNDTDQTAALAVKGNVGIGIKDPITALHVESVSEIHSGGSGAGFSFSDQATTTFVKEPQQGERWRWYCSQGTARLWSGSDKLSVDSAGKLTIGGNLSLSSTEIDFKYTSGQIIRAWDGGVAVGIQKSTLYFRSPGNYAWYRGGTHAADSLEPGSGGIAQMVITNDKIGIGTADPKSTLSVAGGVAIGSNYSTGTNNASNGQLIVQDKVSIGTPNAGNYKLNVEGGDSRLDGNTTITKNLFIGGNIGNWSSVAFVQSNVGGTRTLQKVVSLLGESKLYCFWLNVNPAPAPNTRYVDEIKIFPKEDISKLEDFFMSCLPGNRFISSESSLAQTVATITPEWRWDNDSKAIFLKFRNAPTNYWVLIWVGFN